MNLARAFTSYFRAMESSGQLLRAPSTMVPFLIMAGLQVVVLVALAFFAVAPLSSFMIPIVELLGGEKALHYPMHFILLPTMYHLVYIPMTMLIGFAFFGWGVFLMSDHYRKPSAPPRPSVTKALPSMVAVGIVYVVAVTAVPAAIDAVTGAIPNPLVAQLLGFVRLILIAVIQAFLVYSLLYLRQSPTNPFSAIASSIAYARRHFGATLLVILTVIALHFPMDFLIGQPDKVVLKFRPELVFHLLLAGVVMELITNYLLFAATTSLVLAPKED